MISTHFVSQVASQKERRVESGYLGHCLGMLPLLTADVLRN